LDEERLISLKEAAALNETTDRDLVIRSGAMTGGGEGG
jgi:hypothetical protein